MNHDFEDVKIIDLATAFISSWFQLVSQLSYYFSTITFSVDRISLFRFLNWMK